MRITICDLCYDLGELKEAIANYVDKSGDLNDICKECLETVKELGLLFRMY